MKKIWILLIAIVSPILASAQDRSKWEIFGGYQYTYANYGVIEDTANAMANVYGNSVTVDHNLTMTGGNATFQRNVHERWAAVLDIGGMRGSKDIDISQIFQLLGYLPAGGSQPSTFTPTIYHIMVGPQYDLFKYRRAQIFVRAMGGGVRSILTMDDTTRKALNFLAPRYKTTVTDPGVMVGAGVQYPVFRHFFIRASGDYIHPFSTSTQNYLRVSAGIGIDKFRKPWQP